MTILINLLSNSHKDDESTINPREIQYGFSARIFERFRTDPESKEGFWGCQAISRKDLGRMQGKDVEKIMSESRKDYERIFGISRQDLEWIQEGS